MSCRPVSASEANSLGMPLEERPEEPNQVTPETFYICDAPVGIVSRRAGWRPHPVLAAGPPTLSPPQPNLPPAVHPMAQLLRAFFIQTGHFSLDLKLSLAVYGFQPAGKSKYQLEMKLGDDGKIEKIYLESHPDYLPAELKIKGLPDLKIEMVQLRPDGRLIAKVRAFGHPLVPEILEAFLKKFEIGPDDLAKVGTRPGILPPYPWQLLDLMLMKFSSGSNAGKAPDTGLALDKIRFDLTDSEIKMEMAMESKDIKFSDGPLKGMYFQSYDLPVGEKNRLEISGPLAAPQVGKRGPVLTLWGGKTIGIDTPRGAVELSLSPSDQPIEFELALDPPGGVGSLPPALWLLPYKNDGAIIRTIPHAEDFPELALELTGGVMAEGLGFRVWESGPKVVWHRLAAHQVHFAGLGSDLKTNAPSSVALTDGFFAIYQGRPNLQTHIEGEAKGAIMYRPAKQPEELRQQVLGTLNFNVLKGSAQLTSSQRANGDYVTSLDGNLFSEIPEMGLRVHNPKLGSVRVVMKDATMRGVGQLDVNVTQGVVKWLGKDKVGLRVEAHGGNIEFIQDPTKVNPKLKAQLGARLANGVVSKMFLEAKLIAFATQELELSGVKKVNGVPMLEITNGNFSEVETRADLWGRLFLHAMGIVYPVEVKYKNRMKDALIKVGLLIDNTVDGVRQINISRIFLQGEESADSLYGSDASLCGFRRQHFEAFVDTLSFGDEGPVHVQLTDPNEFPLIDGVRPHFHIFLKDPAGGCTAIGERPHRH